MAERKVSYIAHVEDADDDSGSSVEGIESTRKYAYSEAPMSPVKERPNTGKSRTDKRPVQRRSESSGSQSLTDSDSTARSDRKQKDSRRISQKELDREEREERERERRRHHRAMKQQEEERKARAAAKARDPRMLKKQQQQQQHQHQQQYPSHQPHQQHQRPNPLRHSQTQPEIQQHGYRRGHVDDPSCYGVQQPAAPASRPRAQTRPATYYGGQPSHPPVAGMGWHQSRQQGPPPFPVGTFPPPMFAPSPGSHAASPSQAGSSGYFDAVMGSQYHNNLKQRFDNRPSSAMGFQDASARSLPRDEYDEDAARLSRRMSRTKKSETDRKKMPPPNFIPKRPQSAVPQSSPFAPPPPPSGAHRPPSRQGHSRPPGPVAARRTVGFVGYDEEDFGGDDGLFHDISPEPAYDTRRKALSRVRQPSGSYEPSEFEMSPSGHRGRRSSAYGGGGGASLLGTSYEDSQLSEALRYQDDIGGVPLPLTAETLRKANKRGGVPSSRSTRSSGSRDDSDYKRSNTTGITRVSSDNSDDVIIKVSGAAVVRVQGAEIECSDGEIMFSSRPAGMRGDSDMGSTVFQIEDSRSRVERKALPHALSHALPHRSRAPSQSDSHSRGYAPSHAPYEPAFADNYF